MADGFSLNIDDSLLKRLTQADDLINKIADSSKKTSKVVSEAFANVNNNAIKPFVQNLNELRKALDKKAEPIAFKEINLHATKAMDTTNAFINLMNKINNVNASNTKNSAIVKIEQDIESAKKRLIELQNLLNFYAKGEGKKAIGFTDTSAIQLEARNLVNKLDLLEREKSSMQANARLRMEIAKRQEERDNHWASMQNEKDKRERKSAELANLNAKQSTKVYIQSYEERYRMYKKMFDEIQKKESSLHKRQRQINQKYGDSSKGALNYFDRLYSGFKPQSLNNMQTAISKLQDAQKRLNLNTEEGVKKYVELDKRIQYLQRNISATTNSINNMSKSHRGLMDTAGQLTRKIALVFSVSQIQGYIGKLIQVRGEFELQQKSLQVLLQNKDEADKLWKQTIDLAVRSPFRVKELVSYTRQLAAYRIENEKLHDTTKRLADVSAGLGVDMQRLILAFGQVKAANFLRGTELRQFTEAGIPMLDELAKLFTELEGRMVSAGDVFERISKRMVTFGDVEEVFKRLTNAGGVFYNMQEEQSKTLRGMISNLHDSIDLMLNDIGKANDGLLKDGVNAAKNLVENWREVALYMENVIIALASWKIANAAFVVGTKNATATTLWFNSALKANIGASMINIKTLKWSEAALVGVTKQQWLFGKATMYVQGILRGIGKFAIKTIVPLAAIAGVIELYRHLTKASREAKRLQKDLQEIYNEDTKNLEKQVDTFTYLVEKLKKVTKGSKEHKDVISQLNSQYSEYLGFLITEKTTYDELASSINSVVTALTQKARATTYEKSFNRIIEDSSKDMSKLREEIERGFLDFGILSSKGTKILPTKREINDIFNLINQKVNTSWEELTSADLDEILDSYFGEDVFRPSSVDFSKFVDYSKIVLKIREKEFDLQQQLDNLYGKGIYDTRAMRQEMEKLNQEREKALEQETTRIGKEKIEYDYLVKKTRVEGKYQGLKQSVIDDNVAKIQKTNKTIQDINRRLIESTSELGADAVDMVYITAQDASQGINAVAESMAAAYKQAQEDIKVQNGLIEAGTVHSQETLDNATKMSKAYYKVLEFMGRLDLLESKGNKKEQSIKILNRRIDLVKEINKEYEKLTERFGSEKAKETILKAYKDTFKDAFEGTGVKLSGLVIDKDKLREEGEKSGQIFSEEMAKKMQEVISSGTYIRSASNAFKEKLKKDEGLGLELYDDKTKKIIKTTTDFQKAVGTVTIGYGHAITKLEEAQKYLGREITESEANDIFNQDVDKHVQALNNVLDKYQELILTQEQYDALLNKTFQGGGGLISLALQYATNVDKGIAHFEKLDTKLQKVGKTFEEEFGADFIDKFKNAQTEVERLALVMETMGLTTVASGSNIDTGLFKVMKDRAQRMAAEFRGDLEIVKLLQKSAIDVSQIDFTNLNGVIETLKKLQPIAEKEGKEAQLTLSRAISKIEAEVELEAEVVNEQKILDKIESLFGQYEVSVELEKMNIPPSLIKQMFNVDSLKLPDLKEKIIKEFALGAGAGANKLTEELNKSLLSIDWQLVESLVGKTQMGEIKNKLEEINELQDKELKDRMQKFIKFLSTKADEVAMIQNKGAKDIFNAQNWFLSGQINSEQYAEAIKNIVQEVNESISKINLDKFKDSSEYIAAMGNMAGYTIEELNKLASSITKLIAENAATMSVEEINAYNDALNKIHAQQDKMEKSFGKTWLQELREIKKLEKELTDEKAKQVQLQQDLQNQQNNLSGLKQELSLLQGLPQSESRDAAITNTLGKINEVQQGISKTNGKLNTTTGNISNIGAKLETLLKGMGTSVAMVDKIIKGISQSIQATVQLFNDTKIMLDSFGVDTDTAFWQDMTIAMETLDTMNQKATQGWEDLKSGNIAGAVANAIGVVTTLITGLNKMHDAKYERTIIKETEAIERMQKSYEKLSKSIDDAYSIRQLQTSGKTAKSNLEAQAAAYQRMIQAEESKKNSDKKRIEEWRDSIDDLKEQIADLSEELVSTATAGIMDSVLSASQEFTDAWLNAFQETGDGLSGLEDNFKETMLEMVKQQASMLISQSYIERWKKQLEQYINPSDLELSTDEAKKWVDAVQTSLPQLNQALENYFTAMQQAGVNLGGGELSGLQKGIQSATESTMQAVEAYLNSIRFFVAENNTYLSQIASAFSNGEMENPMVSQLRVIAQQTSAINTLLQSLTKGGHSLGGVGLKVFIS